MEYEYGLHDDNLFYAAYELDGRFHKLTLEVAHHVTGISCGSGRLYGSKTALKHITEAQESKSILFQSKNANLLIKNVIPVTNFLLGYMFINWERELYCTIGMEDDV